MTTVTSLSAFSLLSGKIGTGENKLQFLLVEVSTVCFDCRVITTSSYHHTMTTNSDSLTLSVIPKIILSDHEQLLLLAQNVDKETDRIWERWKISDGLNRSDRKDLEKRIKALSKISISIGKLRAAIYATETVPHI
jgi:hypothetical protein